MILRSRSPFRKVLSSGALALLLLCAPLQLAAAEESPAAHQGVSWAANVWAVLADLVKAIFAADQKPTPPPETMGGDCGAGIDPTGGCRG